jgi:hypothetical protein
LVELTHFVFFKFLDGELADSDHSVPQSYTVAASHLLASIFRAFLCGSLSVAFTQHLWKLLRSKSVKIATIERLFNVRQDFLMLTFPGVWNTTATLFALSLFSWLVPLPVIYPPEALTVIPSPFIELQNVTVQTFNANSSLKSSDETSTTLAYFNIPYYRSEVYAIIPRLPVLTVTTAEANFNSDGSLNLPYSPDKFQQHRLLAEAIAILQYASLGHISNAMKLNSIIQRLSQILSILCLTTIPGIGTGQNSKQKSIHQLSSDLELST